jgi:hypothetical protein
VAAAVAAALVLAGCGSLDGSEPAPAGLRATVEQSRDNENRGLFQLVLHNDGEVPVAVRRVQLRSPGYRVVAGTVFDDVVRPGRRIAFPVEHGAPVCAVEGPAGSVVVAGLRSDGGSTREVRLPVPDDDPVLPRLHARDCALERLGSEVDLALDPGWVRTGDVVTGSLSLTRRGGSAPVRVTDVQSSILFLLRPTGPLPLELPADGRRATLPVEVRAVRCDPHALIESKRSYTFPVFVAVGAAEPLQVPVTADDGGVALIESLLVDHCAARGVDLG